jgi:hypothetical protein
MKVKTFRHEYRMADSFPTLQVFPDLKECRSGWIEDKGTLRAKAA